MPNPVPLEPGKYYHIYNRGNNRETLFAQDRNYRYFLKLYAYHIEPVADTLAYCLLPNHFHLLVRIQDHQDLTGFPKPVRSAVRSAAQAFSNLFNAYAKAYNKALGRTGALFERPFHRTEVTSEAYFARLVAYIHRNPQKHGLIDDFESWPYSSYPALLSTQPTRIKRETVLSWLGGMEGVRVAHQQGATDSDLISLIQVETFET